MCFTGKINISRNNLIYHNTFIFQIDDDICLLSLGETLTANNIKYKLWIEQPENIPTCIALKAYEKETVQGFLKKFKLFK